MICVSCPGSTLVCRPSLRAIEMALDGNVLAEETQQGAFEIRQKRIHFDHLRGERMLPTEGEQLSREDRGPACRTSDFADMIGDRAFHPELVEQQIAIAEDCRKKIIEVVRDAARELAKRFHLLRADELILQLFARGHVHERSDEADGRAGGIADDQRALEQVEVGPVEVPKAVFSRPMIARGGKSIADAEGGPRPILRMNLFLPETDVPACAGIIVSEQSFEALRPGKRAAFYIPNPNSIIRSPGNDRKIFRALNRAAFRNFRASFMSVSGIPGAWILHGCLIALNFGR